MKQNIINEQYLKYLEDKALAEIEIEQALIRKKLIERSLVNEQSAIEWLIQQLPTDIKMQIGFELFEQAKQIEKEQREKLYEMMAIAMGDGFDK